MQGDPYSSGAAPGNSPDNAPDNSEEENLLRQLGLNPLIFSETLSSPPTNESLHPAITFGLCCGAALNIGLLMSLPMVLLNRGAPYVPTFSKRANVMFQQLHKFNRQSNNNNSTKHVLAVADQTFVDLGSGDGRLVARAAHEGYKLAVGYELNPALHAFANLRRLTSWQLFCRTRFYWQDLWKVSLREADVVVVVRVNAFNMVLDDSSHLRFPLRVILAVRLCLYYARAARQAAERTSTWIDRGHERVRLSIVETDQLGRQCVSV
jgi:hypothetical protein